MRTQKACQLIVLASGLWTVRSFAPSLCSLPRLHASQPGGDHFLTKVPKLGSRRLAVLGSSMKEGPSEAGLKDDNIIGFWQLINSTPDEDSSVEKVILRADNQVGGSPRFPEWQGANVSWAGAQTAAGGKWKHYGGANGQRRLEFFLLAPLQGAFERASGERQAMFYDGVILKLLEASPKEEDSKTTIRILGNMTSGVLGGDVSTRRFRGKFSMVKVDTSQTELVPTVQPFARPFNTEMREVEDAIRELDHDPAGMHKRVREEVERIESMSELRESQSEPFSTSDQDSEDDVIQRRRRPEGQRSGDDLAKELNKEVECQSKVEEEMEALRKLMRDAEEKRD